MLNGYDNRTTCLYTAAVTIKCTGECVDAGDAVIQETLLIENLLQGDCYEWEAGRLDEED